MSFFTGDVVHQALENGMFSDGGKGADRIYRDIDKEDEQWMQDQERRYHAAVMKVNRQMPYCLEVFREISRNGNDREASIRNMATRRKLSRMLIMKRPNCNTIATVTCSSGSSVCPSVSVSRGIQGA